MNLKNHTGLRPIVLQGDGNEIVTWAASKTFPWYCKALPALTGGRLANYLVGFLITVYTSFAYDDSGEGAEEMIDQNDLARSFFESFELKNSIFGKWISHNFMRGESIGLAGFLQNGMRRPLPSRNGFIDSGSTTYSQRLNYYIPVASLLGLKGHHTAPLAACFDGATFEIRTPSANPVPGVTLGETTIKVTAMLVAEPEIRLGPGVQWVRYEKSVTSGATKHMIEALGNTSSLQSVDGGAGIAFLGWMTNKRGLGGSFEQPYHLEYVNLPFRGLDQLVNIDGLFADYHGSLDNEAIGNPANLLPGVPGGFAGNGFLYGPAYAGTMYGMQAADFVPLVSPRKYMEVTKLQVVEGTVELNSKIGTENFAGNDVFYALQYFSWTPALQQEFLRKVVDSGIARAVWGTNALKPKTKLLNKQPAGGLNLSKTRFLPLTWEPEETQVNPPGPASAK